MRPSLLCTQSAQPSAVSVVSAACLITRFCANAMGLYALISACQRPPVTHVHYRHATFMLAPFRQFMNAGINHAHKPCSKPLLPSHLVLVYVWMQLNRALHSRTYPLRIFVIRRLSDWLEHIPAVGGQAGRPGHADRQNVQAVE